ncbi:hypothetical protein AAFP35_08305 [Gordonia sp. CPCC 206044]|uniref:hypothetical protein n=1 Tax=Gordonia sp. CPCC 206044 TaxID=3140793 RepID=UPI003AF393CE
MLEYILIIVFSIFMVGGPVLKWCTRPKTEVGRILAVSSDSQILKAAAQAVESYEQLDRQQGDQVHQGRIRALRNRLSFVRKAGSDNS